MSPTQRHLKAVAHARASSITRTEILVIVVLVSLAGLVFGPALFLAPRRVPSRSSCTVNLKDIGIDERVFAHDHSGSYPWQLSTNDGGSLELISSGAQAFCHFQVASNYHISPRVLTCPQDTREAAANWFDMANTNVSYFVGVDSATNLPGSIVAGDRNITAASGVVLQWNPSAPPQWVKSVGLHGNRGHVVFGDGHVEELDSSGLSNALQRAGLATNRFTVP